MPTEQLIAAGFVAIILVGMIVIAIVGRSANQPQSANESCETKPVSGETNSPQTVPAPSQRQTPRTQQGDFSENYPKYCQILTSRKLAEVDENWPYHILGLAVGSHLGMNDLREVANHIRKWTQAGFEFRTLANFTAEDVISEKLDHIPPEIPGTYRTVTLLIDDPFGRPGVAGVVRLCFFFYA